MTENPENPRCGACRAPCIVEQRFCLECGERLAAPRLDLATALGVAAGAAGPAPGDGAEASPPPPPPRRTSRPLLLLVLGGALAIGLVLSLALAPGRERNADAASSLRLLAAAGLLSRDDGSSDQPTPATTAAPAAAEDEDLSDVTEDDTSTGSPPPEAAPASASDVSAGSSSFGGGFDSSGGDLGDLGGDTGGDTGDELGGDDGTGDSSGDDLGGDTTTSLPKIDNVWIVSVPAPDGVPSGTLAKQGASLKGYAPVSIDADVNGVALLAGVEPGGTTPKTGATLPEQLAAAGKTWRAYVTDPAAACATASGTAPFAALPALVTPASCAANIVPLDRLAQDVATDTTRPTLGWIAPAPEDVESTLRLITSSKAYAAGGLVAVVPAAPAGSKVEKSGALLLSPEVYAGGAVDSAASPYTLLRTIEDLFSLDRLGAAAGDDVTTLGVGVFKTSLF